MVVPAPKRRITSGDFLQKGPITKGEGYEHIKGGWEEADRRKVQKEATKKTRDADAKERALTLHAAAVPAAKKLYEAKGDVAVLKKAELYALLIGLKVQGLNAQSGLASILIPKWQALVPTAVREGMEGWEVCARVFWQPEL